MLLRILDKNNNAIAGFDKYRELCITYSLDISDKVMSFEAETADIKDILQVEGYIETPEDRFVIKEIENNSDGSASVVAQLDVEALEGNAFKTFETVEQTIKNAVQLALANTGWTIKDSTVTKKRTLRMTNVSALDIIKQALKTYRCEMVIDSKNKHLSFKERIGEYKGIYFKGDLNLTELTVKRSSYDFYTEIEPIGKDGLTIESGNNGQTYLTNYQYSTKRKRLIWKDERYTIVASLIEDGQAKLDDLAKPYVSYAGQVIDLARANNIYSVLDYSIGDVVDIVDTTTGTKEQQRIVGLKEYPEEWWRNELTYANKVLSFDEMVQKYDETTSTVENITSDNGTIDGSTVDAIESRQIVDLENAIVTNATIQNLNTEYLNVSRNLQAVSATIGELEANVAYIDDLNAVNATIENLDAKYATIENLDATNVRTTTLEADYANINHLLAGNAGVGELQNIHLTSANAVIDQGLIDTLLANHAVIRDLIAGTISTSDIRIGSNDGGLAIRGNLIQFKDGNGVVRIQIGKDTQGNFTFVLYDETGRGQLLNADGITASAIADGLIVNDMVADNAAISAEKLDIASLFRVINENGTETLKANRIYFDDEGQTLNQVYTQMTSSIETVGGQVSDIYDTADEAMRASQTAITTAENALIALQGITTIDALSAQLTNDAHVVHTYYDGTGGDFTFAKTKIICFMGDTDISDHVNIEVLHTAGVTGTWNPTARIYQVTALDTLNGYVDFDVAYGNNYDYLRTPNDLNIQMPDGSRLTIKNGTVHINKRFSISKSPDGQAGVSYNLIVSVDAIRRNMDGSLNPSSITFTANKAKGEETIAYSGIFMLELSTDGTSYTQVYKSSAPELAKTYAPPGNAFSVRCTLYDENDVMLDMQSVIVIADADELADEIDAVRESVSTHETVITDISTGIDGMKAKLGNLQTQIYGLSDGELLVNVGTTYTNTARIYTAYVYKGLEDIKTSFATSCFAWTMETAEGETFLGYGYSITVQNSKIDRDGCVRLEFVTTGTSYLQTPNGINILTPDNKRLTITVEDTGQYARTATYDDIPGASAVTLSAASPKALTAPVLLNTTGLKANKLQGASLETPQNTLINPDGSAVDILTFDDNTVLSGEDIVDSDEEIVDSASDAAAEEEESATTEIQPSLSLKNTAKLSNLLNAADNTSFADQELAEVEEIDKYPLNLSDMDNVTVAETNTLYFDDEGNVISEEVLEEEIDTMIGEVMTEIIDDMKTLSAEYADSFICVDGEEVTENEGNGENPVL